MKNKKGENMKNYWKFVLLKELKKNGKLEGKSIIYKTDKDKVVIIDHSTSEEIKVNVDLMIERYLSEILTIGNVKYIYSILPKDHQKKFWDNFYNSYNLREKEV